MAAKKTEPTTLHIDPLKRGRVTFNLIGTTPMYFNAMSVKAKRTLLIGGGRKTAAEKRELKHDPEREFRDSVHRMPDGPTLLGFPAAAIKGAMMTAALETAGVTKTSVARLIFLPELKLRIWGKPFLKMDVVRSADMNKTPDIRTRAYLPRWAATIDVAYVTPSLSAHSIASLMTNAGLIVGLGDFRQERGRGAFGCFDVLGEDLGDRQAEWDELMAEGREVQSLALDEAIPADEDTEDLLGFLSEERERRAA